jgi:hypothetical protein
MNRNRHALGQAWTRGWTVDFSVVVLSMLVFVLAVCAGAGGIASAADPATYTVDTYRNWLTQYANAKPDFKTGDVLTAKDLERMRPLVPPGYLEQLNFPNFKVRRLKSRSAGIATAGALTIRYGKAARSEAFR